MYDCVFNKSTLRTAHCDGLFFDKCSFREAKFNLPGAEWRDSSFDNTNADPAKCANCAWDIDYGAHLKYFAGSSYTDHAQKCARAAGEPLLADLKSAVLVYIAKLVSAGKRPVQAYNCCIDGIRYQRRATLQTITLHKNLERYIDAFMLFAPDKYEPTWEEAKQYLKK